VGTQIPRLRSRWNRDEIVVGSSIVNALGIAGLALARALDRGPRHGRPGAAWILIALREHRAQLALPDWVAARGMSISRWRSWARALGAVIWGKLADLPAFRRAGVCAVSMLCGRPHSRATLEAPRINRDAPLGSAGPKLTIELDDARWMVNIEYLINPARRASSP